MQPESAMAEEKEEGKEKLQISRRDKVGGVGDLRPAGHQYSAAERPPGGATGTPTRK